MFGVLKAVLTAAPAVISVAAKAPAVLGLASDLVRSAKRSVVRHPQIGSDSDFTEDALAVVAYAASQFKTKARALQCGIAHGKRITEKMNKRLPAWEIAEDEGLIPYLEGIIRGVKSDG